MRRIMIFSPPKTVARSPDEAQRNPGSASHYEIPHFALMSFVKWRGARYRLHAVFAGVFSDDGRAAGGAKPETSVIKL